MATVAKDANSLPNESRGPTTRQRPPWRPRKNTCPLLRLLPSTCVSPWSALLVLFLAVRALSTFSTHASWTSTSRCARCTRCLFRKTRRTPLDSLSATRWGGKVALSGKHPVVHVTWAACLFICSRRESRCLTRLIIVVI